MESDFGFSFGSNEQLNAERDERNLNLTGPIWTRQSDTSLSPYEYQILGAFVRMYLIDTLGGCEIR